MHMCAACSTFKSFETTILSELSIFNFPFDHVLAFPTQLLLISEHQCMGAGH
jgi:hypothetical protein